MICVIPIITSLRKFVSLINPFVRVTLNFSEYISLLICSLLCGFETCTYQKKRKEKELMCLIEISKLLFISKIDMLSSVS